MPGTKTTTIDSMDLTALAEQELDDIYAGAPDRFSDAGEESPVLEHVDVDTGAPAESLDDKVLLVNIYHTEETVFISDDQRKNWTGKTVQFINGRLVTDRDTANKVKAACPHVYEEPTIGEWLKHEESGFQTRNPAMFARYSVLWADNR